MPSEKRNHPTRLDALLENPATLSFMKVSERRVIDVAAILGATTIAGVAAGRVALSKLQAATLEASESLVLNFSRVELITASAFREAVLPVLAWAAEDALPCFLANVNEVTREEALIAAGQAGTVLLFAQARDHVLERVEAVGTLDEKLLLALRIVFRLEEADAKAVKEESGEAAVTTVWNNRLVALTKMGLLRERKVGKTKWYSPVVPGMTYGQ
jgi:hypothetical protein